MAPRASFADEWAQGEKRTAAAVAASKVALARHADAYAAMRDAGITLDRTRAAAAAGEADSVDVREAIRAFRAAGAAFRAADRKANRALLRADRAAGVDVDAGPR